MPKQTLRILCILLFVFVVAGCTTSVGTRIRSYVDEKERVDQNMQGGNMGYVGGAPVPVDRSDIKKTRKIYVLEITKDIEEDEMEEVDITPTPRPSSYKPTKTPTPDWARPIVIPDLDEGEEYIAEEHGEMVLVDYEVQKDDTLQKISKKFYDSYSKWPKIFEANKDTLKDPNRIKPGIVIKVPVMK